MDSSTAPRQSPAWCLLDEQLSGLMFHGIKGHLHKHSPLPCLVKDGHTTSWKIYFWEGFEFKYHSNSL